MRVANTLKRWSIILLISLLIVGVAMPSSSWARTEARYELRTGDAIFGNDLGSVNSRQTLFHQQTLNSLDQEALSIDFPPFAKTPSSTTVLGPTAAGGSSADIVPFGPVDLALPSISETVNQSYSASSTGYYTASFLGIPPINYGGVPVASGIDMPASPVSPPASLIGSSMMFPEMNNIIPGYDRSKAAGNKSANRSNGGGTNNSASSGSTNATQGQATDNVGDGVHETISGQELVGAESSVPLNYTGVNATSQTLSYPYFNFKAKAGKISNASLLDRMWRNSHLGTMGRAYEGDTSYPDWILPTEFTKSAIAMANWTDVNNIALNQTVPGTNLMPRFWSLGITSLNNSLMNSTSINKPTGKADSYNGTNASRPSRPANVTMSNLTARSPDLSVDLNMIKQTGI